MGEAKKKKKKGKKEVQRSIENTTRSVTETSEFNHQTETLTERSYSNNDNLDKWEERRKSTRSSGGTKKTPRPAERQVTPNVP